MDDFQWEKLYTESGTIAWERKVSDTLSFWVERVGSYIPRLKTYRIAITMFDGDKKIEIIATTKHVTPELAKIECERIAHFVSDWKLPEK